MALEALRERDSVQAIAARHELHPNRITAWKRQLLDAFPGLLPPMLAVTRAERHLCGKDAERFGAGYPGEPPPGTDPFPDPGGRKDAGVSPSAVDRLGPAEKLLLSDPKRRSSAQRNRPELLSRLPSAVARGASDPHFPLDPEVRE